MKRIILILCLFLFACGKSTDKLNSEITNIESPSPKLEEIYLPTAPQIVYYEDDLVDVDYSNAEQGYICISTLNDNHDKLKVRIQKDENEYTYDIFDDYVYITYPLNLGKGSYVIKVLENVEESSYAIIAKLEIDADIRDENLPYLYPSLMVNYDEHSEAVKKSFELTEGLTTELERLKAIYSYIVSTIDYDWDKVDVATSTYLLPEVDSTLDKQKGICQDYAALMSAMLRVQKIPCKIITGYVEEGYHAWVKVYIHNIGWINPQIYFEDETWTQVDPTFDALKKDYKGDYSEKYQY